MNIFHKEIVILTLISFFLNFLGIWWGLPNYYSWSVDYTAPTPILGRMFHGFVGEYKYPPYHFFINAISYLPFLLYLYISGQLNTPSSNFPFGFVHPLESLSILIMITRLITLCMSIFIIFSVYLISNEIFNEKDTAFFSSIIVSFSPIFVILSKLDKLDVPMLFYLTVSLYFAIRLLKKPSKKYYILFGLFSALAVSTKEQALAFYILPVIILIYYHIHIINKKRKNSFTINKDIIYFFISFIFTWLFASNIIFDYKGFIYRVNFWLGGPGIINYIQYPNTIIGHAFLLIKTLKYLLFGMTIPFVFISFCGIFYLFKKTPIYKRFYIFLIFTMISFYVFSIAINRFVYPRFILPFILPLSMFGGKLFKEIYKKHSLGKIIITCLIIFSFVQVLGADFLIINDSRYYAENWLVSHIDKNATIEIYEPNLLRFQLLNYTKINKINYTDIDIYNFKTRNPDCVIISSQFYDKLKGKQHIFLLSLLNGTLGYEIKIFKTKGFLFPSQPISYINPTIIIGKRKNYVIS
ncbi:MAG: hypothetical protein DRP13_01030 [Candidatus Aenigmatarchaeota archaeon]|nr:MAG: hypothetical protein DRP13_01030 [Candidatus Aenigmarchaeota archaeon]